MQESLISGSPLSVCPLSVVIPFHTPELFSGLSVVYRSASLHCDYVLTEVYGASKIFAFISSFLYSVIVINSSCKFCGISLFSALLVAFSWCWRAAKIGKTCQQQLSPEMISFFHLALFLLLQFRCIGCILSIVKIQPFWRVDQSLETVRQILRNYLHGLINFCKSMQYVWHAALENSENYVYKNSINFLKIFDSTVQTPFGLSFYAATPTCGIISAESLPAFFFLTCFLLETCQLLALPEALLFLVPREAPAPGLSQKPVVQNERLLQRRLLHPLPSQGNSTKASQRWWPRQDEASLSACQSSFVSSRVQQQGCAECAGVAVSSSPWFLVENGTEGLMIFRNTFCDCSHCTEGRVGQNSASGYLHGVSQTQYDFFFMETFPRLSQNKLELFTNPCIPIHVFCGQECFISIMQTLFTQFRRWTKSRQWTTFLAADQHVKLTHTLLLGFTPGLFSQLLCESLILNLSRISRLQVQIPSAFHHLLLATFSSCGPLIPIAPHFFSKNFPIPYWFQSPPLPS